jgi:hypothetical protein
MIQPSKPKGAKPPIQLKPIVKIPKSQSVSNMKSTLSGTTLTAVEEEKIGKHRGQQSSQ